MGRRPRMPMTLASRTVCTDAQCIVYRLYDTDGTLLYAGLTSNLYERLIAHRATKAWFEDVARADFTVLDTDEEAAALEQATIRIGQPRYNRQHNEPRPETTDLIALQRYEWGQNIAARLEAQGWSRGRLIDELGSAYGLEVSRQAVAQWISGRHSPGPVVQAALADLLGMVHRDLFPPVQIERRKSAA